VNTTDVMLTHDHADNSSLFQDHIQLMAIFTLHHNTATITLSGMNVCGHAGRLLLLLLVSAY